MEKTEKARKTTKRKCKSTGEELATGEQMTLTFPRTAAQKAEAQRIEQSIEEAQRDTEHAAIGAIVLLLEAGLLRRPAAADLLEMVVEDAREWERQRTVRVTEALAAAGL